MNGYLFWIPLGLFSTQHNGINHRCVTHSEVVSDSVTIVSIGQHYEVTTINGFLDLFLLTLPAIRHDPQLKMTLVGYCDV